MIYFDNAATTFPKPEAFYSAIDDANRNHAFNVGRGGYKYAVEGFEVLKEVRNELASYVSGTGENVVFSSSATEALNQIIVGLDLCPGDNVYVSPFEHNAIMRPLHLLAEQNGISIIVLPFEEENWGLNAAKCANMMALNPPKAVFVSQISNVTGYILPYEEIFKISRKYDAINVLDASQGFAIVDIKNVSQIDFVVFAGHKSLYAGFGIAGFIKTGKTDLSVVKAGGTGSDSLNLNMPESGYGRYEAGSPNIVAAYGLKASLAWHKTVDILEKESKLTEYLVSRLQELKNTIIFKPDDILVFGIVSFAVKGYDSNDVGQILADEYDICVRTGYHCAPLVHDFIASRGFNGTIRVSLSYFNSEMEIDCLIDALKTM